MKNKINKFFSKIFRHSPKKEQKNIQKLKTYIISPIVYHSSFLIHGKTKTKALHKLKKNILKYFTIEEL